jgi:sulfur carrier protein ThiS adenylyltransferase
MLSALQQGIARYFTAEQLRRIRASSLFIAGCGGLGSNAAHILVRCGFQRLTLLDCDFVEESNLNRQFFFPDQVGKLKTEALAENLLRLEPELCLTTLTQRLKGPEVADLTRENDILIEAFDDPQCKAAFVSGAAATGKPTVCVSGIAGYGHTNAIMTKRIGKHIYLVGDRKSSTDMLPPLAPRVMVAAAKEADLVLQLVLEGESMDA